MTQWWTPLQRIHDYCRSALGTEAIDNLESLLPYTAAPWWQPPEITIDENAQAATKTHSTVTSELDGLLPIYTDGSGINGKVGAAAVALQLDVVKQTFMGEENTSTVYAAELQGILMALEIAIGQLSTRVVIFTDNQAALKTIQNPGTPSGQYILIEIIQLLDRLRKKGITIALYWIPAHQGIDGNEQADRAAKEATGWRMIRKRDGKMAEIDTDQTASRPTNLKHLRAMAKQVIAKKIWKEWEETWESETRGRELFKVTPRPTRSVLKLHKCLGRSLSTILTQMRTGKIGLRQYLYSRNVPNITDNRCGCRQASQTVAHVLLTCRKYSQLREEIWIVEDSKGRKRRITTTNIRQILSTPILATKAANFLKATELLGQFGSSNTVDQAAQ